MVQKNLFFFQGEDESWSMGGRAAGGGPERSKKGQTEVEVIRDWFVNIFQPVEKTADLVSASAGQSRDGRALISGPLLLHLCFQGPLPPHPERLLVNLEKTLEKFKKFNKIFGSA